MNNPPEITSVAPPAKPARAGAKPLHLNPSKLLLSKWSAAHPRDREKHFLVTRVINPETPVHQIEEVEVEAVLTRRRFIIPWRDLENDGVWQQGWV